MTIIESEIKREKIFPSGLTLDICMGDITRIKCDVIVNAANEHLAHGGGVAAAIVKRGGQIIQMESRDWVAEHGLVGHDQPAYTTSGDLPCKFVIHAVGPRWGEGNEDAKLAKTIHSSLRLANKLEAKSISFPAISTGIFGFPVERAAKIILEEINSIGLQNPDISINKIILVLYDKDTVNAFVKSFDTIFKESK
ncbi:MAG: macro domain-containing protein [Pelolinea sp.]|nr:macro domain-containing protein [Pelolinea sp.]